MSEWKKGRHTQATLILPGEGKRPSSPLGFHRCCLAKGSSYCTVDVGFRLLTPHRHHSDWEKEEYFAVVPHVAFTGMEWACTCHWIEAKILAPKPFRCSWVGGRGLTLTGWEWQSRSPDSLQWHLGCRTSFCQWGWEPRASGFPKNSLTELMVWIWYEDVPQGIVCGSEVPRVVVWRQ